MTDEIKTPRTDEKYQTTIDGACFPDCDSFAHNEMCPYANADRIMAEFARQLERELAQVTAELEKARQLLDSEGRADFYMRLEHYSQCAEAAEAKNAELVTQLIESENQRAEGILRNAELKNKLEELEVRIKELEAKLQEQKQMVDIRTKRAEMAEFLVTETLMALQEKETIIQGAK